VVAGIAQDAPAGQTVRVRLLGPFAVTAGDRVAGSWARPSARRLCELLLVTPGRRMTRDLACEELFPRLAPRAAARSLSKALSMARAALADLGEPGAGLLGADLTHVWLSPDLEVDADLQVTALRAGLGLVPGLERDDVLSAALAQDGELLSDEPYAEWADRARERLDALRQEARLVLARDRAKGAGRGAPDDVTAAWLAVLDHDPACEEAAAALIRGYLGAGRPEQAARVFERSRVALEELGLRISPSLERVYAAADARRLHSPVSPEPAAGPARSASHGAAHAAHAAGPFGPGPVPEPPGSAPTPNGLAPGAVRLAAGAVGLAPPGPPPRPPRPADASGLSAGHGQPASELPRVPREERRLVTMLFAEVAAPAGLAARLGLEALRDHVGASLAAVIAEVEALGGTVSSVSGRGLQAMFGAPETHEDDPERAVRAAYRALSATAASVPALALAPVGGGDADGAWPGSGEATEPTLRIGVESGPAVVGPIGGGAKVEYAALGDVVSVAAALQSAARPGAVLVGPATRAVTAHLFSWGETEEVAVAPGAAPLAAAYLDAPLARAGDRRPRLGGRAPLIGRQAELRLLDNALREAVAGRGRNVLLTGEPGLGKTRLVQESRGRFIGWVGAGTGRRPLWLEGRAASYTSATPYSLFRHLIASWIGIALDRPPAQIRAALADALRHMMGNTNLLAPLSHLMSLPLAAPGTAGPQDRARDGGRVSAEQQRRQVFAAVRALVARFTAMAPTVLVLEDLHWADPTSLRLAVELADLAASRPLLLLATSRPGNSPAAGALTALAARPAQRATPTALEIRLRPLGEADAVALARSLIGQVGGPEVLTAVLASAEGNPLFLEERLAEMLETGALVRQRGAWWLSKSAEPQLPQVLERLVRSRVDRLSPAAGDAIRAAAVLGTEFTTNVLAGTLGTTPAALAGVLAELSASDLVHRESHDRPSSVYRFRHALIQEATYLALLRTERRELHGRAAQALEAVAGDRLTEIATVIGRHYASAEDAGHSVHYLELAGDHATEAFANDEAIAAFREALAVTERVAAAGPAVPAREGAGPADAVRLYAKLANVLWRTAHRDEARAAFLAALRIADAGPQPLDPLLRARLRIRLGRLELAELKYDAAEAEFAAAEADFDAAEALLGGDVRRPDASPEQVDLWLELMLDGRADMDVMRLKPDLALAVLDEVRPLVEARGAPPRKTIFYRLCTVQKLLRNRLRVDDEDIANLRASVEAADHAGEDRDKDVGYATHFLGWALWLRGDLEEAAEQLTKTVRLADRIGESHLRDFALLSLTLTALRRRDTRAVRTLLSKAFKAAEEVGGKANRVTGGMAVAAWLAWQDGRPDEVFRLVAEIGEYQLTTLGSGAMYGWVYLFPLLAAHLAAGATAEAAAVARQIIDPSQQWLPNDLTAALSVAGESWGCDDPDETARLLDDALILAAAHGYF
jgi:class 3 adenylate cyclase/DNA-binding SARP family transcriptional activator/tetratricopeptide (TPR) repeat protein